MDTVEFVVISVNYNNSYTFNPPPPSNLTNSWLRRWYGFPVSQNRQTPLKHLFVKIKKIKMGAN